MDDQPKADELVRVAGMLGAKLYHPQATIGALVSAVTNSKVDLTVLLGHRADADALAEQLLAQCRQLQLLPPDLAAQVEGFVDDCRRVAEAAVSIAQAHGMPIPDHFAVLILSMTMSPGRGDAHELAAGSTLIDQFGKSSRLQEKLDAHARVLCKDRACLEAYESALKSFHDVASYT